MGKIDSSYQARLDGMAFALRVAEKDGIEGLRKELKFRNAHFVPLEITAEGRKEICSWITARVVQTLLTMVLATLRDEDGWGEKRLKRFKAAFEKKVRGGRCAGSGRGTLRENIRLRRNAGERM